MNRSDRKFIKFGPGGINCNCCRPTKASKNDAKNLSARLIRRLGKVDVRRETYA